MGEWRDGCPEDPGMYWMRPKEHTESWKIRRRLGRVDPTLIEWDGGRVWMFGIEGFFVFNCEWQHWSLPVEEPKP